MARKFKFDFVSVSVIVVLLATRAFPQASSVTPKEPPSIVVLVEMHNHALAYSINGTAAREPLRALATLWSKETQDIPVSILIDVRATFLQLGEAEGIVSKAGFPNVRKFIFNSQNRITSSITYGPSLPLKEKTRESSNR